MSDEDQIAELRVKLEATRQELANALNAMHERQLRVVSEQLLAAEAVLAEIRAYLDEDKGAYPPDLYEILSRPRDYALRAVREADWEAGKAAMIEYQQGARRKVPYPTNPHAKKKLPEHD